MTADYPERLIDAPVFRKLRAHRNALALAADDPSITVSSNLLARELQATLFQYGLAAEEFNDRSGLDSSERHNVHSGGFQLKAIEKLLKTASELSSTGPRRPTLSEWVSTTSPDALKLVAKVRKPLEALHELVKRSNEAGERGSVLTEAQRVQLVALLKSLLAELAMWTAGACLS